MVRRPAGFSMKIRVDIGVWAGLDKPVNLERTRKSARMNLFSIRISENYSGAFRQFLNLDP
jgi:hypothetical protein